MKYWPIIAGSLIAHRYSCRTVAKLDFTADVPKLLGDCKGSKQSMTFPALAIKIMHIVCERKNIAWKGMSGSYACETIVTIRKTRLEAE